MMTLSRSLSNYKTKSEDMQVQINDKIEHYFGKKVSHISQFYDKGRLSSCSEKIHRVCKDSIQFFTRASFESNF
jgi:hypothetical protein